MNEGAVSVAVAHVEAELAASWSAATAGETGASKARASTMNFVAVGAAAQAAHLREAVEALAETRAGRVFILTLQARLAPWEVTSDVSVVCHKEGDIVVCYDRIELTFGAGSVARAASVVATLTLSEVPTIIEVAQGAPAALVDPLLKTCNRVIVDSAHTSLARVAEIAGKTSAPIADRAFVRTFSWRDLVARFFDDKPAATRAIRRVEIERTGAAPGKNDPVALLIGWLASRLDWRFESRTHAKDALGEPIELVLTDAGTVEGVDPGELTAIRIATCIDGKPVSLGCARVVGDAHTVRWACSGVREESHTFPLGFRDETWVLLKAIDATEGDDVYRKAAALAADWSAR